MQGEKERKRAETWPCALKSFSWYKYTFFFLAFVCVRYFFSYCMICHGICRLFFSLVIYGLNRFYPSVTEQEAIEAKREKKNKIKKNIVFVWNSISFVTQTFWSIMYLPFEFTNAHGTWLQFFPFHI